MLAPLAPHLAEELWRRLGHDTSLAHGPFPVADPVYLVTDTVDYPVQVNGKKRGLVTVATDAAEDAIKLLGLLDMNNVVALRGGNMAKAVAEIAECTNASGFDVRGFCAGPVTALITSAGMVASGVRPNVVVVSGGSVPKLYMNARDHIKKGFVPLENCIGSFALLLTPDDGQTPVMRLEGIGKHSVGAGASPQAITSALTFEPLSRVGLKLTDVDKYAPELHNAEVTLPAGAGNVPEANYKMIAALSVMKGQIERGDIPAFVEQKGMPGFVQTQGHIPSGVPYVGHAIEDIKQGRIKRAMIIGKGSLFLGRLTNLADGASFIMEAPGASAAQAQNVSQQDVTELLLTALSDVAANLQKGQ